MVAAIFWVLGRVGRLLGSSLGRREPAALPHISQRTASLEALVLAFGGSPAIEPGDAVYEATLAGRLSEAALVALRRELTEDEIALAGECVRLEQELRRLEWWSLERVLPLMEGCSGVPWDDGIAWPDDGAELRSVGRALNRLGWLSTAPEGSETA